MRPLRVLSCAFAVTAALFASDKAKASGTLVLDGDSIAVGQGAPPGSQLADQIATRLGFHGKVAVVGRSGSPVSERVRLFEQNITPLRDPRASPNVIFFHGGDNDIALGSDARQTYAQLSKYIEMAHAEGWKIIVSTELPRFDFSPAMQGELNLYNRLVRENAGKADGVADFASDPTLGGPQHRHDPEFYTPDGIHPTARGYAILADLAEAQLASYLK